MLRVRRLTVRVLVLRVCRLTVRVITSCVELDVRILCPCRRLLRRRSWWRISRAAYPLGSTSPSRSKKGNLVDCLIPSPMGSTPAVPATGMGPWFQSGSRSALIVLVAAYTSLELLMYCTYLPVLGVGCNFYINYQCIWSNWLINRSIKRSNEVGTTGNHSHFIRLSSHAIEVKCRL